MEAFLHRQKRADIGRMPMYEMAVAPVEGITVFAVFLRIIHRVIGFGKQRREVLAMLRIKADTNTAANGRLSLIHISLSAGSRRAQVA